MSEQFVIVVNYSSWRKDKTLIPDLINLRFDTIVMDEAHEMKNTSTSAYRGVREIVLAENCCPRCSGEVKRQATEDNWDSFLKCTACAWDSLSDPDWEFGDRCSAKMVTPMSGTVILNKPQDLFALLSLVDPVNFRQVKDFLRVYCMQDMYTGKWRFKPGGLDTLKHKLSGRYIAREGVKTPGQKIYTHDLVMDPSLYPDQWKVITQLSKHAQILLDSGKKMNILATIALITRKRQANVWPAGIQLKDEEGNVVFNVGEEVTESIKIDKCVQYSEGEWQGLLPEFTEEGDMDLGSRVVVFSQFKGPLKELERRCALAGIKAVRFDGDTPDSVRDQVKLDFDRKYCEAEGYNNGNGPKWQVLLANYKTGGVGLNFTSATEMIELDQEWNPGKEDQARGRIDRMGQVEHTNVHVINVERTIDAWMNALNDEKASLIDGFNSMAEPLSTQLLDAMKNGDML
jgi:SNF2 family DNA or RNA helicase